jgi:hypothetical protein
MATASGQRQSPEVRLAPLAKLVLQEPIPMQTEYVERLFKARRRAPSDDTGKLAGRETPLARKMGRERAGGWGLVPRGALLFVRRNGGAR